MHILQCKLRPSEQCLHTNVLRWSVLYRNQHRGWRVSSLRGQLRHMLQLHVLHYVLKWLRLVRWHVRAKLPVGFLCCF
jgi:hypothetical protein